MKKTIAKVGYFKITAPTEPGGKPTYGAITQFESEKSGGREYSAEPNGEPAQIYADGKVVLSVDSNNGYDIKLTLLDLVDDVSKEWLGRTVDADGSGVAEYADVTEYPRFGLVILEDTTDGLGKLTFYYNCQVSKRPNKAGKTSEGKFEGQFAEFQIAARPRENDHLVCYEHTGTVIPAAVMEPVPAGSGT